MTLSTTAHRRATEQKTPTRDEPTIVSAFRSNVRTRHDHVALRWREEAGWSLITWKDYGVAVDDVASGLGELGVSPYDRVAILSSNRPEWHMADLGILSMGGVTVPLYMTSSPSQLTDVLGRSGATACFVENPTLMAKILLRASDLPALRLLICLGPLDGFDASSVLEFSELRRRGHAKGRVTHVVAPDDLATLVCTSGRTGQPKGTMISHANLMATVRAITDVVTVGPHDRFLSFLPLSHIAERVVSNLGQIVSGGETWFARSLSTVPEDLRACRPTIFFGVPRVWEKLQAGIIEEVGTLPAPRRALAQRYLSLAAAHGHSTQGGPRPPLWQQLEWTALDPVVGASLRRAMGLDQVRVINSGAAPAYPPLLLWFHGIGLPVAEVYGQTEDCSPTSMNPPGKVKAGTVGPPLPGVEVRLDDDGEVLVRGPTVTSGYFNDPSATADLLDTEGWMHSGDLGELDADGYLSISGRKKDLIINAAGKNIAPQEIESRLRYEPLISQAVVVGDKRPYLVALVTLDAEGISEWASRRGKLPDTEALSQDPDLLEEVAESVRRVNSELSRPEQINKWKILPHDFTISEGELTVTLKVRRDAVIKANAGVMEELYA